jgi:hypothetical protein
MKGLPITLLALVFAFFSLLSLLMGPKESNSLLSLASDNSARISEVGLRVNFQR